MTARTPLQAAALAVALIWMIAAVALAAIGA